LTTSLSVKQAMLHDAGSWHYEFNELVSSIRDRLLQVGGVTREQGWEAILLQGSGTYGVEAVFQTCVRRAGKVAVLANGAYGNRIAQMLAQASIEHVVLKTAENKPVDASALERLLSSDGRITHVAMVHCETTTGILNPIEAVGQVARAHRKVFVVDAMSSFGAIPIDPELCGIDFIISSPNKCLESVPGFCFVLCRRQKLADCEGQARSLSLDLGEQLKGFERNGQFRYTQGFRRHQQQPAFQRVHRARNLFEPRPGLSVRPATPGPPSHRAERSPARQPRTRQPGLRRFGSAHGFWRPGKRHVHLGLRSHRPVQRLSRF
jgi:2-aminoethylphosphonate-pyruvate transaminase